MKMLTKAQLIVINEELAGQVIDAEQALEDFKQSYRGKDAAQDKFRTDLEEQRRLNKILSSQVVEAKAHHDKFIVIIDRLTVLLDRRR